MREGYCTCPKLSVCPPYSLATQIKTWKTWHQWIQSDMEKTFKKCSLRSYGIISYRNWGWAENTHELLLIRRKEYDDRVWSSVNELLCVEPKTLMNSWGIDLALRRTMVYFGKSWLDEARSLIMTVSSIHRLSTNSAAGTNLASISDTVKSHGEVG